MDHNDGYVERMLEATESDLARHQERLDTMPKVLFKYKAINTTKDLERIHDILTAHRIYMPNCEELNDPFEGITSKLIDIDESQRTEVRKKWRILSMSEEAFGRTLWGNYAGNNRGLCIGFRTHPNLDDAEKVDYRDCHGRGWFGELQLLIKGDFMIKHPEWSAEQEWRILRNTEEWSGQDARFLELSEDDIVCVICGCDMPECVQASIQDALPKKAQLFKIEVDTDKLKFAVRNVHRQDECAESTKELIKLLSL